MEALVGRGRIAATHSWSQSWMGWAVSIVLRLHFTLRKGFPVRIGEEAGWAPTPVWVERLEEKSCASAGDWTVAIQSIVRHFTDWATPAPCIHNRSTFFLFHPCLLCLCVCVCVCARVEILYIPRLIILWGGVCGWNLLIHWVFILIAFILLINQTTILLSFSVSCESVGFQEEFCEWYPWRQN
jgi:hypothetical protein